MEHKEQVAIKSMDIRELKVCLSRATAVVSNDTGPRHIAAALSVPTIVLLGPWMSSIPITRVLVHMLFQKMFRAGHVIKRNATGIMHVSQVLRRMKYS